MSTPLSPQEIHSKIANAHEGQAITFKVRKPGTSTVIEVKGTVKEIVTKDKYLVVSPQGRPDAKNDMKIPEDSAEYLEISLAGERHFMSVFDLAGTSLANDFGIVEYDLATYVTALKSGVSIPLILASLDKYFDITERRYFTGSQEPQEEEKAMLRDNLKYFLMFSQSYQHNEEMTAVGWGALIRLCGMRRTKGLRGAERVKTMTRAYTIRAIIEAKERDKLWMEYNQAPPGTAYSSN